MQTNTATIKYIMTRINLVEPSELHYKHLVAEYRELPRIFKLAEDASIRGWSSTDKRIPSSYRLGSGHVTFFYNKLGWLSKRFSSLVIEMQRRGYNPTYTKPTDTNLSKDWYNDWCPTPEAINMNKARILDRMPKQ